MSAIKAFGLQWNPDFINWSKAPNPKPRRWCLRGAGKNPKTSIRSEIELADMAAVYCLYRRRVPVYVGMTSNLRDRIKSHYLDEKTEHWTSFSWFGFCNVNWTKQCAGVFPANQKAHGLVEAFEAVGIYVSDAELNSKTGGLKNAVEFRQIASWVPSTDEERLKLIYRQGRI